MTKLELSKNYSATIRLRSGDDWQIRPGCEAWDGRKVVVQPFWLIEPDERSQYAGEFACNIVHPKGWPAGWIASGDLADFHETELRNG